MTTQKDIPSSSSSPLTIPRWTYDVFLSFRGEDTRRNFTDHLYAALNQKGIYTFRDDEELERGKSISRKLLKAIEESRFVVVILSRNYANSTWCLDEVTKTVECMKLMGQTILPVFYDVNPSEVRKQTGNFEKAFCKHEQVFKDNTEKVSKWRKALHEVGNLSGWHLQDGYESKVILDIVGKIFNELNQTISSAHKDLVGIESRVREMLCYLSIGVGEVRIIGIWGMGGMGKTTIAQAVSERIHSQFEAYSFLANVRERTEKQGLIHLQKQLLSDILLESNVNIQNVDMGMSIIRRRLHRKMVLVILDDVDQLEQLEALSDHSWFGSGSRIIITTRDEHLLRSHGVDNIYEVKRLTNEEALQLFSWKSFKKDKVEEEFLELSKSVLKYADGLPLAIKVLGSFLFSRDIEVWSSALGRLKENPDRKIIDVLKVSFDSLMDIEKKVFLDIACFFIGEDKDRVTRILETTYGHHSDIDIEVLMDKSLVYKFGKKLEMHDLIQELGWEIVRRECLAEPGKRSRMWLPKDIIPVLVDNKGTTAVEGIFLNLPEQENIHLRSDPFSKMCKLRLLKIHNVRVSGCVGYLSNELQLLEWHACPLDSFPSSFQLDKLVELSMHSSRIKQLWRGNKPWTMLKLIDLCDSQNLIKTPNFFEVPNLETLVLEGCIRLVEVHPSIGFHKKLILWNMNNCKSVESLPPFISLKSLESLTLSGCSGLKKFPEIEGKMKRLLVLHLDGTAIKELPPSIEHLTALTLLNLGNCKNLMRLPSAIQYFKSLESLILTGCSKLNEVPENLNSVECLKELDVSGTAIRESSFIVGMKNLKFLSFRGCKDVPSRPWHSLFSHWWPRKSPVPMNLVLPISFSGLSSLTNLDLSYCNLMDGSVPNDIGSLLSLKNLNLSGNTFVCLPESISQLSKLEYLTLRNCSSLQLLPKLPLSVRQVDADDCTSLIDFPNQIKAFASAVSGMTIISSLISSELDQEHCTSPLKAIYMLSISPGSGMVHFSCGMLSEHQNKLEDGFLLPIQNFQRFHELRDYRSFGFQFHGIRTAIPEWFNNINSGDEVAIWLPPDLYNDRKWVGVAICVVVSVKEHPDASLIECDSETSWFYGSPDQFCKKLTPLIDPDTLILSGLSHLVFVFYEPCLDIPNVSSDLMSASFKISNSFLEVQKCGIQLIFDEDVAGFIKMSVENFLGGPHHQIFSSSDEYNQIEVDKATFESGWFNLVNKILRWEKFIPISEEGSSRLLRRNIESLLPRYLEGLKHKIHGYHIHVSGSGSPAWFNPQVGSSVSIELPQNLHRNKKWMGFAVCASIAVNRRMVNENYRVSCRLQTDESYINLSLTLRNRFDEHLLEVMYLPRAKIPDRFIQSCSSGMVQTSFEIHSYMGTRGIEVEICGFRILYQQDLQGFVQTVTDTILRSSDYSLSEYYNALLVKDWINLIRLQSHRVDQLTATQLLKDDTSGLEAIPLPKDLSYMKCRANYVTPPPGQMNSTAAQFLFTLELMKFPSGSGMCLKATLQKPKYLQIYSMMVIGLGLLYVLISHSTNIHPSFWTLVILNLLVILFTIWKLQLVVLS